MVLSSNMNHADTILPCVSVRNITFIPYIDVKESWRKYIEIELKKSTKQIMYLIKDLLETPCFTVWAFSPLQSRVIRLTDANYLQFFETKYQAIVRTDRNDVLRVLMNIPQSNDDCKQTLLFYSLEFYGENEQSLVLHQLKKIHEQKLYDVVMWCGRGYEPLCEDGREWLPKQNVIADTRFTFHRIDSNLHQVLIDLMNNPQYDWSERYTQYQSTCRINKNVQIYFWEVKDSLENPDPELKVLVDLFLINLLPNTTLHVIGSQWKLTECYRYTYSAVNKEVTLTMNQTNQQIKDWLRETTVRSDNNIHVLMYDQTTDYKSVF